MSRIKQLMLDGVARDVDNTAQLRREASGREMVFVYGSLKKGYPLAGRMQGSNFIGNMACPHRGIMFHLGPFPACNFEEPLHVIHGELHSVSPNHLRELDVIEGVPHHYLRVSLDFGDIGPVWTYVFGKDRASRLTKICPHGVWQGSGTPTVNWLGFGQGLEVGVPKGPDVANNLDFHKILNGKNLIIDKGRTYRREQCAAPAHDQRPGILWFKVRDASTNEVYGPFEWKGDTLTRDGVTKPKGSLGVIAEITKKILLPPQNPLVLVGKPELLPKPPDKKPEIEFKSRIGPGSKTL